MTKRRNFSKSVKVACIKRATIDGIVYCEGCGHLATQFEIDHINPDGLTGEPILSNAKLLCRFCHRDKTGIDIAAIAKAKRREASHLNANPAPSRPMQGQGFQKSDKAIERSNREPKTKLQPRAMFK